MRTDTAIVIPNYNHEVYLIDAIQSAEAQTYPCDIIIVDDGSTDKSPEVIREFASKNKNIKAILKENGGPGSARNAGVRAASDYKYVQLLDADDILQPQKVEILREIIEREPEVGIVYDDYFHLYNYDGVEPFAAREFKRSCTYMSMWADCLIHCNSLVRRSVFEDARLADGIYYDEQMRVAQDYDFWLRAIQHCVPWHHPEPLSFVRVGKNNSADPIRGRIRLECMKRLRNRNAKLYL